MFLKNFRIVVASLPDREEVVSELYYKNYQWVEISQEEGEEKLVVQFYSHPQKEPWVFPFDEALEALQMAKERLLKMGPISDVDKINRMLLKKWEPLLTNGPENQDGYDIICGKINEIIKSSSSHITLFEYLWMLETKEFRLEGNKIKTEEFARALFDKLNSV